MFSITPLGWPQAHGWNGYRLRPLRVACFCTVGFEAFDAPRYRFDPGWQLLFRCLAGIVVCYLRDDWRTCANGAEKLAGAYALSLSAPAEFHKLAKATWVKLFAYASIIFAFLKKVIF
jgi:hypothetical protein